MAEGTAGARIADLLHQEGVDTIFSIELGVRIVGPRHESAGVHMADGLSRMTGRPQVVMAGMGPGAANLIPGVVCASTENIPVVVIATQRVRTTLTAVRHGRFQFTPQVRLFEPVVKYAAVVDGAHRIDEILRQAFRQATTGRPGPVYVEVPHDVMTETRDFPPLAPAERYRPAPQEASQGAIEAAVEILGSAKLPLIVAGTAIHTARVHGSFRKLAELLQCPVLPSPGGRGSLPETHPQVLPFLGPGQTACQEADCVIAVGSAVGEPLHFGGPPQFAPKDRQRWILIERDPGTVGVNREFDVPLIGDLREVIPQLTAALEKRGPFQAPPQLAAWRREYEDLRRMLADTAPETVPIHPGRSVLEIREAVPDEAVIVRDGGSTGLFEAVYGQQRSSDFLWTSKFGHLGTGLPYAIAAQLAVGRDRPVCLISGDSSLGFNLMEIETAVRHDLPVLVVVNYDQHWGMEAMLQQQEIGRLVECETAPVRLDEVARGLGAHGEYCTRTAEIGPAIRGALEARKPAIVQIVVDPKVNAYEAPGFAEFALWYQGNY
jgi:thiamine pyrophosphate-dependent acetolactate synthase large subunit-like protein